MDKIEIIEILKNHTGSYLWCEGDEEGEAINLSSIGYMSENIDYLFKNTHISEVRIYDDSDCDGSYITIRK